SKDDRFGQVAHRTSETSSFTSQIQISLFLSESMAVLEDALRSFNDLAFFQSALHFQRFGDQPRVLHSHWRLPCNSIPGTDVVRCEGSALARINIQRADDYLPGHQRNGQKRIETRSPGELRIFV